MVKVLLRAGARKKAGMDGEKRWVSKANKM